MRLYLSFSIIEKLDKIDVRISFTTIVLVRYFCLLCIIFYCPDFFLKFARHMHVNVRGYVKLIAKRFCWHFALSRKNDLKKFKKKRNLNLKVKFQRFPPIKFKFLIFRGKKEKFQAVKKFSIPENSRFSQIVTP